MLDTRWMIPLSLALLLGCDSDTTKSGAQGPSAGEAKIQTAKLFDAAASHYMVEHPTTELLPSPNQCPNDGQASGSAGLTPPLSVQCALGDDGQCIPGGTGPGAYPTALWTDNPVWNGLNFEFEQPHRFHYDFRWAHGGDDCSFTVQAFADLDNDGIYSTYERTGRARKQGVDAAIEMRVDHDGE